MKENIAIIGGKKEFPPTPILIAKDKNAKVYNDVIKEKGERPIYLCDTALSEKL